MSLNIKKTDIIKGLFDLGLKDGDTVVVHSSLSCFGNVEGGADAVVDAILDVITDNGTLVVPTYTIEDTFNPESSPSVTGAITEAVRKRPNAHRSLHPTHSVAAIGSFADVITEGHENVHAFGRGSALFKVLQVRGKILQLGTTFTSTSMIHVAEEIVGLPYLDRSQLIEIINSKGKKTRKWIRRPGCSHGFDIIEDELHNSGLIAETMIGNCRARLVNARDVVETAIQMLKEDPEALLCDRPDCSICAEARAMITATEIENQDKEVVEYAEEEERTVRLIERQFGNTFKFYESDKGDHSLN